MVNAALEFGWEMVQLSSYAFYFTGLATILLLGILAVKATFKKITRRPSF